MSNTLGINNGFFHPSILTILATYRCTAECEHCCFESNPRIKGRLSLEEITTFIGSAAQYRELSLVVFSGGECFLLGNDLNEAIKYCKELGLRTRCVSNGYWAKSLAAGRARLAGLKRDGLDELNISTGDFHQQFVSQQTVSNAATLGVELGLGQTLIVVEMRNERKVTKQKLISEQPELRKLTSLGETVFKIIESPWMPMSITERIDQRPEHMLNMSNVHLRQGCTSIHATLVLTPHRKLGFCCGLTRELIPELNTSWPGSDLDAILEEAGRDFMKIWLLVEGPERILAWAASKNVAIEWENRYAHHCHVCLALFDDPLIRQTIKTHYRERVDDVLMRYFLLKRNQELHATADLYDARVPLSP